MLQLGATYKPAVKEEEPIYQVQKYRLGTNGLGQAIFFYWWGGIFTSKESDVVSLGQIIMMDFFSVFISLVKFFLNWG